MMPLKNYLSTFFLFLCVFVMNTGASSVDQYSFAFRSSVVYGSQTNDLTIYMSTDFNGGSTIEDISQSNWKDITAMATLSSGSPFVGSGNLDFTPFVEQGKALFIAFKYSAPATPKPTQRMWRIQSMAFKHNRMPVNLSDWLFINHKDNDENVGWENNSKGIQYRSRMTKKKTESWAVVQILLPDTKPIISGRTVSFEPPAKSADKAYVDKNKSSSDAGVTQEYLKKIMYDSYLKNGPNPGVMQQLGNMEVLEKTKQDGYERWHVKYKVDTDEFSYAYILLPLNIPAGAKLPLMLCPHPTYIFGKNRVVNLYDEPIKDRTDSLKRLSGHYGLDLVQRGFVVFAPDRAGYGERRLLSNKGFKENMAAFSGKMRERYPKFGLNGKAVWDLQVGLNLMLTYDFVDQEHVGIIGHSLGAWDAILLSALDDRVKAAVINSGGMVAYLPELWSDDQTALRVYLDSPSKQSLTKNVNIMLMLNASRSVFYLFSLRDPFYKGQPQLIEGYTTIYDYYKTNNPKKQADISYLLHKDGHTFYPTAKAAAYTWLEERLMTK
ncbi:DUF5017 domain-containing protein [Sphingobacterium chuzhouense]|uniref:DUF5017 domain-containing protein n=1 Tax=Sphingobacterium chuzhouense TaxID=1742264 RepID=A0ABR7XUU5_9SPHI|nr:DUF5017 domain-containing protein [Sphingobacterium chuzhouense]MBD1422814.1 DUF5017 domain-containing protein [Sphingobacterium chuzhouense]